MSANYGPIFTSRFSEDGIQESYENLWASVLKGCTPRRIGVALEACFSTYSEPFTPAQFRQQYVATPRGEETLRELPRASQRHHQTDREVSEEWIAVLKAMLAGRGGIKRSQQNVEDGVWTAEHEAAFQRDMAVVGWDQQKEPHHTPGGPRACAYHGCESGGTIASSTLGSDVWWCTKHAQMG